MAADETTPSGAETNASVAALAPGHAHDARPVPQLLGVTDADVGRSREVARRRRLRNLAIVLGVIAAYLWYRALTNNPLSPGIPEINWLLITPLLFFVFLGIIIVTMTVGAGRSPHVLYRPEQIDTRLDDVIGIDPIKEDVVRSLNLFLAHKKFADEMGGTPRRGLLFEGAPGTGKTYLAKAMAAESGVPFLFVSATSFQSMYYGATARKIRSYFKALRKAARQEGGAIGFIEEIDAIGMARGGMSMQSAPDLSPMTGHSCGMHALPATGPQVDAAGSVGGVVTSAFNSEGVSGVVNELLIQMQSFDEPTGFEKFRGSLVQRINLYLPPHRQLKRVDPPRTNILLIAATNRADNLDPALLRPGRFDRRLTFEMPTKKGRAELIDHFLSRKAHAPEVDTADARDRIASATSGYSPVMIEHLFDEALVNAMRRGERAMSFSDIEKARLIEEVGLGQPVEYTDHERRLIATHESGHAVAAHVFAPHRRLEILTIIKRRQALGLLAHGDREDVYTQSRAELIGLIRIALGGQAAEEIFFNDVSTGPGGDLLYATNVGAQMVGATGMMGNLVSFAAVQGSSFNAQNLVGRVLGDRESRDKVEELLQEQKVIVRSMLEERRHLVEGLRDALIERSELVGTEITDVLEEAEARNLTATTQIEIDLRDGADRPT